MRIDANAQITGDMTYINAVKRFLDIYEMRFFSFFNRYELFFRFSSEYKQYKRDISFLQTFTKKIIEQRKQERCSNQTEEEFDEFGRRKRRKVFLDILLDSDSMSDTEIREEVDTFLFGVSVDEYKIALISIIAHSFGKVVAYCMFLTYESITKNIGCYPKRFLKVLIKSTYRVILKD